MSPMAKEVPWKQVAWIVALAVLIVLAVYFGIIRRMGHGLVLPDELAEYEQEFIDIETGELFMISMAKWEKLGKKGGLTKSPDTGDYTLHPALVCPGCGAKFAPPREAIIGDPPYTPAQVAARNRALINAKCPGCGAGTMSPGTVPRPVSPPVPGE